MEETARGLQIGARLRDARQGRGLTLQQLAALCGVSKSMLSKVERGESVPTVSAAVRIAAALSEPLTRLLGLDEGPRVEFCAVDRQQVLADPASGTTRYRMPGGGEGGIPRVERLVAPPGAGELRLPDLARDAFLIIAVSQGRMGIRVGAAQWRAAEGDSLAVWGPAQVALLPLSGEAAAAYLVFLPAAPQ